ncbi:MAG: serine--tRNA ligase [Bacteroidetes bacterium MED-G17]|nr:MAG: serine--tRNA ligase [Bacteroidetes bacterium MED-G17]CAI8317379.1 MAG: Serine--tRNA ligase [Bacteroidetes bacterium MED-G17]|tara:strand:- start:4684 stop:5952 length:1269 start_codon:yes stop_codon:yes gene_type:complete
MLELGKIREDLMLLEKKLEKRGGDFSYQLNSIVELDRKRRKIQVHLDTLRANVNKISQEMSQLFKTGQKDEADKYREKSINIKNQIKSLEEDIKSIDKELQLALFSVPNTPHETVPSGRSSEQNQIILEHSSKPTFSFKILPHWELAEKYKLINFELGVKITGAGFPVYMGKGAQLQRALINFFLDEAKNIGYQEVQPPILINQNSGYGTGQLPDKDGQMYYVQEDDLFLIPTAEVPITNLYRGSIVEKEHLPIKHVGYTPCFRREAGSYGKDVRGLNRLHQFDKVEIVQITDPKSSYKTLEEMSSYVQNLLQKLELPYRVLNLCGGDLGFTSSKTYDMEVWSAAQERWLEVSSVSNFETFQSNRLKLRINELGDKSLAHTLNGSALALPRIVAAILENNQTQTSIQLPKVLHSYLNFTEIT